MVWNTIVSIITCRSVWSITILARFITQTNSDDTNPPSYFWKQYIYNGDRRPWAQIDEISQTGRGLVLKIMRKFACVKLLLQLWCENPISNLGVISLKTLTLTRTRPYSPFAPWKNIIRPKADVHLSPSHCFGDTGLESHCSGGLKAAEMIDVVKHFNWETYVAPSDRLTMSPCAATVWLERNERQMMIFCWHSLNISILWSGYKSTTYRITLKQKKTFRTIYNIWWQIGHFEHFSPPETLQVQIQSQSGWSRFLVSILYSETAIVLHVH